VSIFLELVVLDFELVVLDFELMVLDFELVVVDFQLVVVDFQLVVVANYCNQLSVADVQLFFVVVLHQYCISL